ncbi:hypothetical protein KNT64_gp002 [Pseudomonas phage PspYZU05]|uniref:Uncharacterized protein n=1 Tax=Pseudomonas phage PspYZU05 TaxID=1983556 RepID=A0A2U7NJE1_9CAUD|nr:hypothetical protein KNT64_gp002 [Pseudomonas phage PspYZU05]ASD51954.1 hypothetical protein PspYZU05_02 [Pseudomonas phage PspYZU05]
MLSLSALELIKATIENVDSQEVQEFVKALEIDPQKDGICSLYYYAAKFLSIAPSVTTSTRDIRDAAEKWVDFSGDRYFPVPVPKYVRRNKITSASTIFATTELLWEGEYGQLRMSLLNHLIETAKTQGA